MCVGGSILETFILLESENLQEKGKDRLTFSAAMPHKYCRPVECFQEWPVRQPQESLVSRPAVRWLLRIKPDAILSKTPLARREAEGRKWRAEDAPA